MHLLNYDFKSVAQLSRSPKMYKVLQIINKSRFPLNSNSIAHKTDLWQGNVIGILNRLSNLGVVSEVAGVKRGRMYIVTNKGISALEMMEELLSSSS